MESKLTSALTWSILDRLHEGVIIATSNGDIVYTNDAAFALLASEQEFATLDELFQVIAPDDNWQTLSETVTGLILPFAQGMLEVRVHPWQPISGDFVQVTLNVKEQSADMIQQLAAFTRISSEQDFDKKLRLIVDGLMVSGWNRVVLTLRDEDFNPTKMITAGFTDKEKAFLKDHLLPIAVWEQLFSSEEGERFRRGTCFFVPGDSEWSHEYFGGRMLGANNIQTHPDSWHSHDVLAVPLLDRQQRKIGLLGLDEPRNGRRPNAATLQTVELYAQFAASAIENTKLVAETLGRSRELETLFQVSKEFAHTLEKDRVISLLGQHLMRAVQADGYTVYQWLPDIDSLKVLEDFSPVLDQEASPDSLFAVSEAYPILVKALETMEPVVVTAVAAESPLPYKPAWLADDEICTTILLPISLAESPFGVTAVTRRGKTQVNQSDLDLLVAICNQANIALETAFIFAETFERERFYNALGNVTLALNFTLDLETVLNLICSESLRIFNVDGAYIWLRKKEKFIGRAAKGHAEDAFIGRSVNMSEANVFVNHIAQTGQAMFVNDISRVKDVRFKLPQRDTIQAALGVPLEQEGNIVGVLVLIDTHTPHRFGEQDVAKATIFGAQTTIALKNAQLFAELRQLNEELDSRVAKRTQDLNEESNRVKVLLRITSELSASLDQDRVLSQALHLVNEAVHASQGVILLIDPETGELMFRSAIGTEMAISHKGLPSGMMRDEGLAGWMIENRSSVIVHDTRKDPRWVKRPSSEEHRSVLAVPLMTGEEVIGVLMLFHIKPNAFTMQQLDLVEAAAIQVANAISNANLYLLIRDQAERLGATLHLEQIETAKNQAILESIADGVIVADQDHKIILANLPASSILGIPRKTLLGKSINEFLGLYGQTENSWLATIRQWAKNADRIEQWTYIDEQLNFENKVVSVHLSPVLTGKQFFGTVSIFRDITKEVELDRLKSEFVSTVSHELRTPMTSIKGYVDLMLMGAAGKMSDSQQRYLKVIKNNADRLHMLVNDLLDISRIETGKTTLDLRPADVSLLIEQIVEGHLHGRIQHEGKTITVKADTPPTLPMVNMDRRRIMQVLTNLLDNAFNYTPEYGEISLSAEANGRYVYISVHDTGIGIAAEDQGRIFDRFYRAESEDVQKVPGTGLGLAIVRSLVEMHGGTLTLQSEPGVGSTFTFNLPIAVESNKPTA
ncbi:MAG: GAF domain-containing protein [Ardenticatenaceae bacterium]|nr:GAF domain-containing protein [Anaerolineales bacterium]MCB8922088.1 GAF domain-containing protein [Ardenticatenaceae bacterium]MCB9003204.1 GAF domain-containing protein [Ardenticatenaceae bacterium]